MKDYPVKRFLLPLILLAQATPALARTAGRPSDGQPLQWLLLIGVVMLVSVLNSRNGPQKIVLSLWAVGIVVWVLDFMKVI